MKLTAMSLLVGLSLLTGCTSQTSNGVVQDNANNATSSVTTTTATNTSNIEVTFDEDDYYTKWSDNQVTKITLGNTIEVNGAGAQAVGSRLTITSGGTYVISGALEDGQIIVNSATKDTVRLVLNGAQITSLTNAPIHIQDAGKVVISLEEGTENTLTDGATYILEAGNDEPDAALFSKADLTINGTGTLKITAHYKDGIGSKDDLKIIEGNLVVQAADDGIRGKDMVAIKNGNISITAAGDGIKSTNNTDAGRGFVYIENGNFDIKSENDAIQAETNLEILDGTFNIVSGGGSANGPSHAGTMMGMGGMQHPNGGSGFKPSEAPAIPEGEEGVVPSDRPTDMPALPEGDTGVIPSDRPADMPALPEGDTGVIPTDRPELPAGETAPAQKMAKENAGADATINSQEVATTTTEDESTSMKAIKATQNIIIKGGTFTINAADDAIHSNQLVNISGGNLTIETGDDGIHADVELVINDGKIDITKSYEGLEAEKITVQGGETHIVASDDGVNAAESTGVEDTNGDLRNPMGSAELMINDGYLYVNAQGDGLDANGTITVSGGTVIVDGPTNGGNGALDYDKSCDVNGGTFIASGSAQMAQSVSSTSTQNAINMTFPTAQETGQSVAILDENGNAVVAFAPSKSYQAIVISSPLLETGKTYTYAYGGTIEKETVDGLAEETGYINGTVVTEFTISESVTYLNESGVTTASTHGMMGGFGQGGRGQGGQRGHKNQATTSETDAQVGASNNENVSA